MKITSIALASAFCFTAAGPALMNTAFAAENDNPQSARYRFTGEYGGSSCID